MANKKISEKFRLYITERVRKGTLEDVEHNDFLGFGGKGKGQTGLYLFAVALAADKGCDPVREKGAKYESFVMDKSVQEMPLVQMFATYLGMQDSLEDAIDMIKVENWRKIVNDWLDPLADDGFKKIDALMRKPKEVVTADLLVEMDALYKDLSEQNPLISLPEYHQFAR